MNSQRLHTAALAIAFCIPLMQCIAALFYSPLTWGVNLLHFAPTGLSTMYLGVFFLALIAAIRYGDSVIGRVAALMDQRPTLFLSATIILLLIVADVLRVKAPLLGDSFVLIRNFENTFNGTHTLHLQHEPFALYYFYLVLNVLGISTYPAMMDGFLYGEMFLLAVFITVAFQLSRSSAEESRSRLFLFLFLLIQPGLLLFCGYAEIYSVVLTVLAILVLLVRLHLRGAVPLAAVISAWILLLLCHVLALVLVPALLYLAALDFKKSGMRSLIINFALLLPLAGVIWITIGPEFWNLLFSDSGSHLLRSSGPLGEYDAYTVFSQFHLTDLLNLFFLLAPFAPLLLFLREGKTGTNQSGLFVRWLIIAAAGFGIFLLASRFDLGMAKDWDVTAPWFFLISLFIGVTVTQKQPRSGVLAVILVTSLCTTGFWLGINGSESPPVRRAESFLDTRIISHSGEYQSRFHLASFLEATGKIDTTIALWDSFIQRYPRDYRGYENQVSMLMQQNAIDTTKIRSTFLKWISIGDTNETPKLAFAGYLTKSAKAKVALGLNDSALADMYEAVRWDSANARLRNDFGMMLSDQKKSDEAAAQYRAAIALDPDYAFPYVNLGNYSLNSGKLPEAISLYRTALALDPSLSQATFNLGVAFLKAQQADSATFYFNMAATEGNEDARKFVEANQQ